MRPRPMPRGVRKRTRGPGPQVPRKKSRTSTKKRVKTGSYAGILIASKPVKVTKKGIRIRERYAATGGTISDTRRLWCGANTIGDEEYFFSLVAEAFVQHVLTRISDTRADKDVPVPGGFLERIDLQFSRDEMQALPVQVPQNRSVLYDIDASSSSFNGLVYNNIVGATPNLTYIDTFSTPVSRRGLREIFFDMAIEGYFPSSMFLFRTDSNGVRHEILRDAQVGRANIKINIAGLHKFQNVTPADHEDSARYNANAIDANPISGKIYTFRNLAPKWNQGWLAGQPSSSATILQDLSGRPLNRSKWDYKQISSVTDGATGVGLPLINEFKLPVLRTRAVFSNAKTATNVSIPPGGFKTYTTKFTYDGSLARLCRDITQVTIDAVGSDSRVKAGTKYPSLGASFLLCLTPSMKTGGLDDAVTVAFDFTKDGQAHMTKYSAGVMPTTNVVE